MSEKKLWIVLKKGEQEFHLDPEDILSVLHNPDIFEMPACLKKTAGISDILLWQSHWIPILSFSANGYSGAHFLVFKTPCLLEVKGAFYREFPAVAFYWNGSLQAMWCEESFVPPSHYSIRHLIQMAS